MEGIYVAHAVRLMRSFGLKEEYHMAEIEPRRVPVEPT